MFTTPFHAVIKPHLHKICIDNFERKLESPVRAAALAKAESPHSPFAVFVLELLVIKNNLD